MLKKFLQYNKDNNLFDIKQDKILLAVSGGMDSMVMTDLFLKAGCDIAIAHCNFHLRGKESDRDEEFVTSFAKERNIKLFTQSFDTFAYMQSEKKSLEMSARDLRYEWFAKIIQQNNFTLLATAHHGDDSAETIIINLLRGTGIAGLHGILPKSNNIIRPMLFASRSDIAAYAESNSVKYVVDSTNSDNKFTRNKIRNEIIPLFREISPDFDNIIRKDTERLRETETVFRTVVDNVKKNLLQKKDGCITVELSKLKELNPIHIYMYEILSEFGFNETNINSICGILNGGNNSGKQFYSEKYRIVIDRKYLLITPKQQKETKEQQYTIEDYQIDITQPLQLHVEILKDLNFIKIPKSKNIAMFDYDKLQFPLVLRHWKNGDVFFPFGMNGKQKLSDFFTHNKYSLLDKESQWLLCSGDDIIWVVGERLDNRYRITDKTRTIYRAELDS
ncbi:MAG: tRNA lysidine(34) synthetase TilS [Bacteroidales bacterium]|nr:tRNA lysidine(34) synthetase TilS [Bacteroidales bacterium]